MKRVLTHLRPTDVDKMREEMALALQNVADEYGVVVRAFDIDLRCPHRFVGTDTVCEDCGLDVS